MNADGNGHEYHDFEALDSIGCIGKQFRYVFYLTDRKVTIFRGFKNA